MAPPFRLLIVDDEADITQVLKIGMEAHGFHADPFTNPQAALAKFKAGTYDMALLDIRMNGLTGFELFERLHTIDPKMKICFITAYDFENLDGYKQLYDIVPSHCYLRKPLNLPEIVNLVRRELGEREPALHN